MQMQNCRWASAACLFAVMFPLAVRLMAQDPGGPYPSPSPLPSPPYAIVTYPSTDPSTPTVSLVSRCAGGVFALVGLQPDQVIQVVVQYPTNKALQLVSLEALDGGMILPPSSVSTGGTTTITVGQLLQGVPIPAVPQVSSFVIAADGRLTFTFKATHDPGRNQVSLRQGSQELGLQFWVFDLSDPQNNPPAITPATPYPSS